MRPKNFSARPAALWSTFASSVRARLFLLFIATSATSKPAPLPFLPMFLLKFPAITSSCPKSSPEDVARQSVMVNLDSFISNLSVFRQNTPSFWGKNESHYRNCIHSLCGHLACSSRQPRRRRRATSLRLFRRIFPHRAPLGRKTSRHTQHGQSPHLHAKALGAPAPRRLTRCQGQRR